MRRLSRFFAILALTTAPVAMPAMAAETTFPVIKGYGGIQSTQGARERPDKAVRYRIVANVTKAPAEAGKVNPTLERVARLVNLLGADGVRPQPGDIVAIVHGPATLLVLTDAAYRARLGVANPNIELIERLREHGVEVHVCSQAVAGNAITHADMNPLVQLDVSAGTTLANLQLRGYALIPD